MSKSAQKTVDKRIRKVENKTHKEFRKLRKNRRLIWQF